MPSRRALLLTGGTLLLAAGGGYLLNRRPDHAAATAALWSPREAHTFEGLVHYATLAANSHNAQPCRFGRTRDGVAIRPDLTRALPVADGDNHHLFVSLGCAAENLMLAAGAAGRSAAMHWTPDDAGRLDIALGARGAARVDGAELLVLTEPAMMARVLELILAANAAQVADQAFAAELKSWLRFNARAAIDTGDGLYAAASGNPTLPDFLGGFMFDRLFTVSAENDRYARQVRSSAGLAIIHSDRDEPAHWIQAGRACQRFALQATALGIRHAHLNQPVEVADVRPQLQALLGLGDRRPDLVLRFGYAPPMPRALRRPVAALIDT